MASITPGKNEPNGARDRPSLGTSLKEGNALMERPPGTRIIRMPGVLRVRIFDMIFTREGRP